MAVNPLAKANGNMAKKMQCALNISRSVCQFKMPLALANGYKRLSCLSEMEHYSLMCQSVHTINYFSIAVGFSQRTKRCIYWL